MSRIPRRRVRHAAATLIILSAACAKQDRQPGVDTSTTRISMVPASAARLAASHAAPVFPGALSKPIDDYTGDELFALTKQLTYVGSHERDRECKHSSGCGGPKPTKKTKVQVSAVATQDSLVESNVPQFGVIYTRAINKGTEEEARYGLRADKKFRYYMIVQRDTAGGMRWRLEELDTNAPRRHTQIASGKFEPCGHAWTPGARADFKTCSSPERGDTVITMPLMLQASDLYPVWVSCGMGCCIYGP